MSFSRKKSHNTKSSLYNVELCCTCSFSDLKNKKFFSKFRILIFRNIPIKTKPSLYYGHFIKVSEVYKMCVITVEKVGSIDSSVLSKCCIEVEI